ncbi:methyl-accepting chemotaxis protein [Pelosinus propionicus]|uniref:Methyl-accepting chemotaxis sensory transducer with Cache sensor n=1 Tax=Pelosinus propionicus DSM 13327 TaxID=1123291 RepID=A0A1I4Q679_9FIRM|nr:methyl-accepting chemotaxis protein [Pelosinus propionicus]SFM35608.1 methyl-accepting chemotaxis sensory transducer with Cache sensor [Pelosinus propionicus DSM 13327]
MKIKNIQTKLLINLIPLILVVLLALSGVSYYLAKESLEKSVDDTGKAVGTDYSNRVRADVGKMVVQLEDLASIQRIRTGADKVQIAEAMAEMKNRLGIFDVVAFISPDGSAVTSTGEKASYSDREYFKKVIATNKSVISDPLISKATGKLAVVLAVPVTNNGQLTGVLLGTVSMERLSNQMKELKFLETGYGQITDDSGLIIAHPKQPELIGKLNLFEKKINPELKLQKSELDERLIHLLKTAAQTGEQSMGEYTFVDGIERVAIVTPINLPGDKHWFVMVVAPLAEVDHQIDTLTRMMLIISIICLLLAVVAIVFIAKQFVKPILILRDECMLLSQGDLRQRDIEVSSEDEIGQLAKGFRDMRANLHELVTRVHSQSEQLAASSEELTASAEQSAQAANQVAISITGVASGSHDQLSATNETSAVVQEMSASIEQVSATTTGVAEQSNQAAAKAKEGNTAVNKAVMQMKHIEQTVQSSAHAVAELGERSKEIGQIVATISGIAGQTNLLALNAAIEAARAGEQGRGFAVVAEEVRKLAEQSQDATEQISSLIGGIQEDTNKAVKAMDAGNREVKLGAEVVDAAGQAFQEIVLLVTQVSDQMKEISLAIDQMANGSQQIVDSVNRIDTLSKKASEESETVSAATEEQSASMEEIASSSQSLANLATELREAVQKFQV